MQNNHNTFGKDRIDVQSGNSRRKGNPDGFKFRKKKPLLRRTIGFIRDLLKKDISLSGGKDADVSGGILKLEAGDVVMRRTGAMFMKIITIQDNKVLYESGKLVGQKDKTIDWTGKKFASPIAEFTDKIYAIVGYHGEVDIGKIIEVRLQFAKKQGRLK